MTLIRQWIAEQNPLGINAAHRQTVVPALDANTWRTGSSAASRVRDGWTQPNDFEGIMPYDDVVWAQKFSGALPQPRKHCSSS
jgi:hypothetical protein